MTPEPARFNVKDLSVSSQEITPLTEVVVTAIIENSGGSAGYCPVIMEVNGQQEEVKEVSIEAGKRSTVMFTLARELEGIYTVNVNGRSVQFAVVTPQPTLTEPAGGLLTEISNFLWWIIGGVVLAIIVLLFIFLIIRRRT